MNGGKKDDVVSIAVVIGPRSAEDLVTICLCMGREVEGLDLSKSSVCWRRMQRSSCLDMIDK